jgi:hypothetical protein
MTWKKRAVATRVKVVIIRAIILISSKQLAIILFYISQDFLKGISDY